MLPEFYHGPRPIREIRAVHDDATVRVYQAFSREIALPALEKQTFVAPFSFVLSWASWIKPSFLWTMKRTAWGKYTRIGNKGTPENEGNAVILGVDVKRSFFDWILSVAQVTHFPPGFEKRAWHRLMKECSVYVQWDPEKDLFGRKRTWKAIQIGLKTPVLRKYADSIVRIVDMGDSIREIVETKDVEKKIYLLPNEGIYQVADDKMTNLRMR